MTKRFLIVEDEATLRESLKRVFGREGYDVEAANSAEEALSRIESEAFDVILTDIILPGIDGIELLGKVREQTANQIVIVMTAYATLDTAVRALRAGAYDYVIKPVIHEEIKRIVRNALQTRALQVENVILKKQIDDRYGFDQIVGESPPMRALLAEVRKIADSRSNVLLLGETGTGKELFARAVHAQSSRHDKPFVPINCSAIPENLIESELFGYHRGAFTGAAAAKSGLFEEADGGTVFLDEIGELDQRLQSKLLRVIDDREIRPLGSTQSRRVDLRFVAATNLDITAAVAGGGFREDLYYRLNVITLRMPPLRERREDIPLLIARFIEQFAGELGKPLATVDPEALGILQNHGWPGNVRELRNIVERVALIAEGRVLLPEHIPESLRPAAQAPAEPAGAVGLSIKDYTKQFILAHQGRYGEQEIAAMLGITRKALWEKRKRWGLKHV
ncbi:MAG: sigma-54-dependent transcriptional regulator [Candidatus Methylomirabilia bacterium]